VQQRSSCSRVSIGEVSGDALATWSGRRDDERRNLVGRHRVILVERDEETGSEFDTASSRVSRERFVEATRRQRHRATVHVIAILGTIMVNPR